MHARGISDSKTLTFSEDVKGWTSFKSFLPENHISCANKYFTMLHGKLYQHDVDTVDRNTFYEDSYRMGPNSTSNFEDSLVTITLNEQPGSVKSFHTLDYEGSQSKIDVFGIDIPTGLSDTQPYNLVAKDGWYVSNIITDKQEGSLNEFIEKEGKWFNYIKGTSDTWRTMGETTDFGASDIQGIGVLESISGFELTFANDINVSLQVGDTIHFQTPSASGGFTTIDPNSISLFGNITGTTNRTITIGIAQGLSPNPGDYIMFSKNAFVNISGLLGYYADVTFKNNSHEKVEMFSVGSEITESSK